MPACATCGKFAMTRVRVDDHDEILCGLCALRIRNRDRAHAAPPTGSAGQPSGRHVRFVNEIGGAGNVLVNVGMVTDMTDAKDKTYR